MNLRPIIILLPLLLLTSCSVLRALFGGEDPSQTVERIAHEAANPTTGEHSTDLIEMLVYALAALGLPSVARIVMALRPVLVILLRAALGRKAPEPAPTPAPAPAEQPKV